jgi:hypothetical protein
MTESLLSLLDNKSLFECKQEIDNQFDSIAHHQNEMKLAVMVSFILNDATKIIRDIDTSKFIEKLKEELECELKEAESLKDTKDAYIQHLEKNSELIIHFESREKELKDISDKLEGLLSNYDKLLRDLINEHCRKTIAEIEALL